MEVHDKSFNVYYNEPCVRGSYRCKCLVGCGTDSAPREAYNAVTQIALYKSNDAPSMKS